MTNKPKTIQAYIEQQLVEHRGFLNELHQIIKAQLPQADECIAWSMPSFKQGTYLAHFQAFKEHVNVYLGPEAVGQFKPLFPELIFTTRGLKLNYSDKIPVQELSDMLRWNLEKFGSKKEG